MLCISLFSVATLSALAFIFSSIVFSGKRRTNKLLAIQHKEATNSPFSRLYLTAYSPNRRAVFGRQYFLKRGILCERGKRPRTYRQVFPRIQYYSIQAMLDHISRRPNFFSYFSFSLVFYRSGSFPHAHDQNNLYQNGGE